MSWIVGCDVGGTFTDLFAIETATGETRLEKVSSTPANPADAILQGLKALRDRHGVPLEDVRRLAHGTTVATNALIQRRVGNVAVITTRGFRDLLEIGRQTRPFMYDMHADAPPPLSPRRLRFEVNERVRADGAVHRPLDMESVGEAAEAVAAAGVDAVAVCFLFAFVNDAHERAVAEELARRCPELPVSLSSEVQPEFREYERFSTTTINACLQPVLGAYIGRLEKELANLLSGASVGINQSSGGLMSLDQTRRFPVRTALSGPAAGVVGAANAGTLAGRPDLITLDVGGTSADVALIRDGRADIRFDREVAGFPIRLPMVDIHTIGAGGGSIAWFDRDDLLKVGPASAGADPGPACYGRGGTEPTVSDANLVLGRLSPDLVDGGLRLDPALARKALDPVADRLGLSREKAAHGIIRIMVANMVRALRTISVERGHDPRRFCLMPFGGAGPLHAREVARELDIREYLVPPAPGIICAEGLIVSDLKENFVAGVDIALDDGLARHLEAPLNGLLEGARDWAAREDIAPDDVRVDLVFDMRFVGQNFELRVPVCEGDTMDGPDIGTAAVLRDRFLEAHTRAYGFANADDPVEIVNLRLTAHCPLADVPVPVLEARGAAEPLVPRSVRPVIFDSDRAAVDTPVYRRGDLRAGDIIEGPAIIDQLDTTVVHFPGDIMRVLETGALLVEVSDERF